jgi:hypothetical protein
VCVCVLSTGSQEEDGVQEVASLLTPMTSSTSNTPKTPLFCVPFTKDTFFRTTKTHLQLVTFPEYEKT